MPVVIHRYGVYGISLRSEVPLSLPEAEEPNLLEIGLYVGSAVDVFKGGGWCDITSDSHGLVPACPPARRIDLPALGRIG